MMRILLSLFILTNWSHADKRSADCARSLAALRAGVDVYEFAKANADKVWAELASIKLKPSRRLSLALGLAEADPQKVAERIDSLGLTSSQRNQVALKLAEVDPSALTTFPGALPKSESERVGLAVAASWRMGNHSDNERDRKVEEFFQLFGRLGLSEPHRFQVALAVLGLETYSEQHGRKIVRKNLAKFDLSLRHRLEIGEMYGPSMLGFLDEFRLTKAEKFKLAKKFLGEISSDRDDAKWLVPEHAKELELSEDDLHRLYRLVSKDLEQTFAPVLIQDAQAPILRFVERFKLPPEEKARILVWFFDRERDGSGYVHLGGPEGAAAILTEKPDLNFKIINAAFRGRSTKNSDDGGGIAGAMKVAKLTASQRVALLGRVVSERVRIDPKWLAEQFADHPEIKQADRVGLIRTYLANNLRETRIDVLLKQVPNPSHQKELILSLSRMGRDVSAYLDRVKFDPAQRMEILRSGARTNPKDFVKALPHLNLSVADRYELAKAAGEADVDILYQSVHLFSLPEKERLKLALIAAERSVESWEGPPVLTRLMQFNMLKPENKYALAKAYVVTSPDEERIRGAARSFGLSSSQVEALRRVPFARDPFAQLAKDGIEIPEDMSLPEIQLNLRRYAKKHPSVLKAAWIDLPWDKVKKRETGLALLRHLYEINDYEIDKPVPRDSLALLSVRAGTDEAALRSANLSENRLGTVYELLLDIRSGLKTPPFEGVTVEPGLWKKDGYLELLQRMRDLLHIMGNGDDAWHEARKSLQLETGIHATNLPELTKAAEQLVASQVQKAFAGQQISLSYEDIASLKNKWGDLEPIFNLVSRFKGKAEWHREIPTLGKIFEASLQGRFEAFKFEGDPSNPDDQARAHRQTAVLGTPEAKAEWRRPRSVVDIFNPNGAANTFDPMPGAKALIQGQLKEHLALPGGADPQVIQAVADVLAAKPDPAETFDALMTSHFSGRGEKQAGEAMMKAGMSILETSDDPQTIRKTAAAMNLWASRLGIGADVRNDLKDVMNRLRPNREQSSESIVFSTTLSDPKSLITIGDLVGCSSCQNYRTGEVIDTLPGYVIDANVQAVASFNLPVGAFRRPAEYELVKQAVQKGLLAEARWDGGRRTVTFEIRRGDGSTEFITSNSLNQAYRRHMVKLGQTDAGSPGIFLERAYESPVASQALMAQQIQKLRQQIATAIGGVFDQKILVKASRNPSGHYSDAASTTHKKTEDYYVGP